MDEPLHEGGLDFEMVPVPYAQAFSASSVYNQKTFLRRRRTSISLSQTQNSALVLDLRAPITNQGYGRVHRRSLKRYKSQKVWRLI